MDQESLGLKTIKGTLRQKVLPISCSLVVEVVALQLIVCLSDHPTILGKCTFCTIWARVLAARAKKQRCTQVMWPPRQETSLASSYSNLGSFGSKCTLSKTYLRYCWAVSVVHSNSVPESLFSPCPPQCATEKKRSKLFAGVSLLPMAGK